MSPIFTISTPIPGYRLIAFEIPDGITSPDEFASSIEVIESSLTGPFIVCITGDGPTWGYAMIVHAAHASKAVAIYDPNLGYVIVQSHTPDLYLGQTISLSN
jgi:CRISPR-associated protein Csx3